MINKNLKEGINLTYLPGDKFKTVHIRMNIYRPMGEEAAKNALISRILKSGCKKYNKTELETQLESLYGAALSSSVSKVGDVQVISLSISLPSDRYTGEENIRKAAKLLYEVVFNPLADDNAFAKEIFGIEKNNLKNLIDAVFNDKREYAEQRCIETMFEGDPFAVYEMGTPEQLAEIDEVNLKAHYDKILAESKIDLFVSGSCDVDSVCEVFENIKSVGEIPATCAVNVKREPVTVMESQDVNQGKLMMGFKTDVDARTDDYYKLIVFNSVFGSGTHSKLFCNVREKLSLAYYAASRLVRSKSAFFVASGIEFENFDKAKDEILFQLEEIRKGNITEFELVSSKKSIVNALRSMEDEPAKSISSKISNLVLGVNDSVETAINKVKAVTEKDVAEMASRLWLDSIYFLKGKENEQ